MAQTHGEPVVTDNHPVRRFLVVGCGGSGGATLAYLMDQLRSDLPDGVTDLPRGWQFVHLDVPLEPDAGPDGLRNIQDMGGSYLGFGFVGGMSDDVDRVVCGRLGQVGKLSTTATWTAVDPSRTPVPVVSGAGQYREVGRMLTLNKLPEVRTMLRGALDRLYSPEADADMARLTHLGGYAQDPSPLVLVISSMAGGSGASMALDVCRVLSSFGDINTGLIGVYMYGADVFQSLTPDRRSGVNPNALAMLGEIVATQTGAAQAADAELYQALGVADGAMAAVPFGRVFPVGMYKGKGGSVRFGDGSPRSVYRGLARGLAGLIMSPTACHNFISYDLTNIGGASIDASRFGWGAQDSSVVWGSFGFASLSMGRDRYAEYAAQRLARGAVDRLVDGHLRLGATETGREQLSALLGSQFPSVLRDLNLDVGRDRFASWLADSQWPMNALLNEADDVVSTQVALPAADQQDAGQWRQRLDSTLRDVGARMTSDAHNRAYAWVSGYHRRLFADTKSVFEKAVARFGLVYAADLARALAQHIEQHLVPAAKLHVDQRHNPITELARDVAAELTALRGIITGNRPNEAIRQDLRTNVGRHMYREAARLLVEVWSDYATNVLEPLTRAIKDQAEGLALARRAPGRAAGLAFLSTDHYPDWPTEDPLIPPRFAEASNEVLITTPEEYHGRFEVDIINAADTPGITYQDARRALVGQVIEGEWQSVEAEAPPRNLLAVTEEWIPQALAVDPRRNETQVPRPASFAVRVRPQEVLDRARRLVARSNYSFANFTHESLRSYVAGIHVSDTEVARRRAEVARKFEATLGLALPLSAPNVELVRELHYAEVKYRFKFSAVPFMNTVSERDLEKAVEMNTADYDVPFVLQSLRDSMNASEQALRVDVFGSYQNMAPVCFDSVLKPAIQEWNQLQGDRASWWRGRRARPLSGGVPAHDDERRAMVAGWFVGQIVGKVRLPDPPEQNDPVQIFDRDVDRWLAFPHPLLTPYRRFRQVVDWLPAVLESMVLALAASYQSPVLESLRPYRALRGLYDSQANEPSPSHINLQAQHELAEWMATGGRPDAVSKVKGAKDATTPAERADAVRAYLTQWQAQNEGFFLPPHEGGRAGAPFGVISSRGVASQTPLMRDLTLDIRWAIEKLIGLLEPALAEALRIQGGGSAGPQPSAFDGLELT